MLCAPFNGSPVAHTPKRPSLARAAALVVDGVELEYIRYTMTDSSMQHGRDFQHIVMHNVRGDVLVRLFDISLDLASMWSPTCNS